MNDAVPLNTAGAELARALRSNGRRLVLAESCTGGLVAATLARTPGISEFFCGSFVVYRIDSKIRWIDVPESILVDPGPVSGEVALAMARGARARTPEADLALSITGHLGPNAPPEQDGLCYIGWHGNEVEGGKAVRLRATDRASRQSEAALAVLEAGLGLVE